MHYVIDGYNLLFYANPTGDDIQKDRNALLHQLDQEINTTCIHATIVFDAHSVETVFSRTHKGNLEIVYTDEGSTADDYILEFCKRTASPSQLIIVTSDKKLAWGCRYFQAKTMTVEKFIKWLKQKSQKKAATPSKKSLHEKIERKIQEIRKKYQKESSKSAEETEGRITASEDEMMRYLKIFEERLKEKDQD